jgi:hypothetical protein
MITMTSFVVLSTLSKLGLAGPPLTSHDAPSQPSQLLSSLATYHRTILSMISCTVDFMKNLSTHATIIIAYSCAAMSLADYFLLHNMGSTTTIS